MTFQSACPAPRDCRGFTLIEVTLVISVLLGIISIIFLGAESYRQGANRALCIQNMANVQAAMRSYCNFYELNPGETKSDLREQIFVKARFFEIEPTCPSGREYAFFENAVPPIGTIFMQCSDSVHLPQSIANW